MSFQKAVRSKVKLRLGIYGPSGSGKTYGSLMIAKGLGGKIALADSECGSSLALAKQFDFDIQILNQFDPETYIEAIKESVKGGYNTLIIDSLTHEWISIKESVDDITAKSRSNNSFTAWKEPSKQHKRLIDAILNAPIHILCTMREKDQIIMSPNEQGKLEPTKMGTVLDQRKGLEYEFITVFHLDRKHIATTEKDRTALFDHFQDPLSEQVGIALKEWVESGEETEETRLATQEQKNFIFILLQKLNSSYDDPKIKKRFMELTKKESMSFWTHHDLEKVKGHLEKAMKEKVEKMKDNKPKNEKGVPA